MNVLGAVQEKLQREALLEWNNAVQRCAIAGGEKPEVPEVLRDLSE